MFPIDDGFLCKFRSRCLPVIDRWRTLGKSMSVWRRHEWLMAKAQWWCGSSIYNLIGWLSTVIIMMNSDTGVVFDISFSLHFVHKSVFSLWHTIQTLAYTFPKWPIVTVLKFFWSGKKMWMQTHREWNNVTRIPQKDSPFPKRRTLWLLTLRLGWL